MTTAEVMEKVREIVQEGGMPTAILILDELSMIFGRESRRYDKESQEHINWKYMADMTNLMQSKTRARQAVFNDFGGKP